MGIRESNSSSLQGPEGHPGGYPRPPMGYPYQFPPGHAPGPQGMYMRDPSHPYPQQGQHPGQHPGEHWRYRQPFPGGAPTNQGVGPTFYGEQQIQRYPANAIQPPYSPSSTPRLQVAPAPTRMNNLGKAKSEKRVSDVLNPVAQIYSDLFSFSSHSIFS